MAQSDAGPSGGGRLSVRLAEAEGGRTVETTLRDDDEGLAAGESFFGAANTAMMGSAYVSTRGAKQWLAGGDGAVVVQAFDESAVTLDFVNVGQFAVGDTFVLSGRVTVPLLPYPDTSDARGSALAISSVTAEPITDEPANMAATSGSIAAASTRLGDVPVGYSHDQRAMVIIDASLPTPRNVVISFPRGHLPHAGDVIALNDFDSIRVAYTEGASLADTTKRWEADRGTATVTERTAATLSVTLSEARMQSESPAAKGMFLLDGTVRVAVPPGG